MAGTGQLNSALGDLATKLGTIVGLPVVRDPRNITPGCVLIQAPTFRVESPKVIDLTVPVTLISSGPGNQDALDQLLTIAAQVIASDVAVFDGRPVTVSIGNTDAPGYELTIRMKATP